MNLGTRLNNWLNIRPNPKWNWDGQIGTEKNFIHFIDVVHGLRAGIIDLTNKVKGGFNTIRKILYRYAPPAENPTEKYIVFVVKATGIDAKAIISTDGQIDKIIRAMCKQETGNIPSDKQMSDAWALVKQHFKKGGI